MLQAKWWMKTRHLPWQNTRNYMKKETRLWNPLKSSESEQERERERERDPAREWATGHSCSHLCHCAWTAVDQSWYAHSQLSRSHSLSLSMSTTRTRTRSDHSFLWHDYFITRKINEYIWMIEYTFAFTLSLLFHFSFSISCSYLPLSEHRTNDITERVTLDSRRFGPLKQSRALQNQCQHEYHWSDHL